MRFLEISHKNGRDREEKENGPEGLALTLAITMGRRAVDDLQLLCKPCNSVHTLELKYGSTGLKVAWNGEDTPVENARACEGYRRVLELLRKVFGFGNNTMAMSQTSQDGR